MFRNLRISKFTFSMLNFTLLLAVLTVGINGSTTDYESTDLIEPFNNLEINPPYDRNETKDWPKYALSKVRSKEKGLEVELFPNTKFPSLDQRKLHRKLHLSNDSSRQKGLYSKCLTSPLRQTWSPKYEKKFTSIAMKTLLTSDDEEKEQNSNLTSDSE